MDKDFIHWEVCVVMTQGINAVLTRNVHQFTYYLISH